MSLYEPLVSIILPAYNAEKYIHQSLKSCLEQTYSNLEIIIINDGSTDLTLDIINSFKDERIHVISRENKGLICSLNEGIDYAKGELICRMDADDICMKDRVNEQVEIFRDSSIDVVFSGALLIDDNGSNICKAWVGKSTKEIISRIDWYNTIYHPTVMMRKESLKIVGGYKHNKKLYEDKDLWIRFIKNGNKFHFLNKELIKYRLSKTSVHSNFDNYWYMVANSCIVNRNRSTCLTYFPKLKLSEKMMLLLKAIIPSCLILPFI
ncbi:glycosyltransferase, partial [Vibrio alginolyticus]|nr:glycosyltransferase [Vibrio alginolyticus]